ncbi:MAG: ligase-associated DNA damage response endonuclease PdeM [Pseudomonadota bacterium]
MGEYNFMLHGAHLTAHPSGVLTWGDENLMIVSDLHLGKSSRMARRSGVLVPPYETTDTLARLTEDIIRFLPKRVICLGDSFDDLRALDELSDDDNAQLSSLMAGREWIWIEGNHDAGPVHIGGTHLADLTIGTVTFRHIADPKEVAEISGHYHPKAQLAGRSRPCFLIDKTRVVMPAFGTYTGGLRVTDPAIQKIMQKDALAVLTGDKARCIPAFS